VTAPSRKARPAADAEPRTGTNYPEPFRARVEGRTKRALGDLFGLDQFGMNLTELQPGAFSALRHWHSHEDEMVYVLEGEVTLITDEAKKRCGRETASASRPGPPSVISRSAPAASTWTGDLSG